MTQEYRPYIDDPASLSQFEGQRFVVIRAGGDVVRVFDEVKHALRRRLPAIDLSYLAQPHVTLAGFARGTDLESVRRLAAVWAPDVPALAIDVEGLDALPDPFRVVMLRVRRTPDLVHALSSLRRLMDERGPRGSSDVAVEAWTFHMSVAYGAALAPGEWDEVERAVPSVGVEPVGCTASDAEVVAFDNGVEHLGGLYDLSGRITTGRSRASRPSG